MLTSNAEEAEVGRFYEDLQYFLELILKKDVLFIIGDWNAKVGSPKIAGLTGQFGLGVQDEAGQRLIEFYQENTQVMQTSSSNNTREDFTHGHHQMVNTEIRLIILFAVKDGETTNSIFHRTKTNNFTICMEIQKTSNNQSNLEKEEWNWRDQPA